MKKEDFERANKIISEKEEIDELLLRLDEKLGAFLDISISNLNVSLLNGKIYINHVHYLSNNLKKELINYSQEQGRIFLKGARDILTRRREQIDKELAEL